MNFTDRERNMSHSERARLSGYDARYEGKTIEEAMPATYSRNSVWSRLWRAGWHKANEELGTT
jgi:ribosome modulation factor